MQQSTQPVQWTQCADPESGKPYWTDGNNTTWDDPQFASVGVPKSEDFVGSPSLQQPKPPSAVLQQHTFSIDQQQWEAYHKAAAAMHVPNGCPNIAQLYCCVPGLLTTHIIFGTPCFCASVMDRVINPYEEQILPEWEQKALVITPTGVSGYRRPENEPCMRQNPCMCSWYWPEYPVRRLNTKSWKRATLTWDNIDRIDLVRTDSSANGINQRFNMMDGPTWDPLLRPCGVGVGILCGPCYFIPCFTANLPDYTGLRIISKAPRLGSDLPRPDVTIEVIALKEDGYRALKVLNAAWDASKQRDPNRKPRWICSSNANVTCPETCDQVIQGYVEYCPRGGGGAPWGGQIL